MEKMEGMEKKEKGVKGIRVLYTPLKGDRCRVIALEQCHTQRFRGAGESELGGI